MPQLPQPDARELLLTTRGEPKRMRIQWFEHKGRRLLYFDLSRVHGVREKQQLLDEYTQVLAGEPERARVLVNIQVLLQSYNLFSGEQLQAN